jgi:hypothetical protein
MTNPTPLRTTWTMKYNLDDEMRCPAHFFLSLMVAASRHKGCIAYATVSVNLTTI